VQHALAWLAAHGQDLSAPFVLQPLLESEGLSAPDRSAGVQHALAWLAAHGQDLSAQFVLRPLLESGGLSAPDRSAGVQHALAWLQEHQRHPDGQAVLKPLIIAGFDKHDWGDDALNYCVTWIRSNLDHEDSYWRLSRLLHHLGQGKWLPAPLDVAELWIRRRLHDPKPSNWSADCVEAILVQLTRLNLGVPAARIDDLLAEWVASSLFARPFRRGFLDIARGRLVSRLESLSYSSRIPGRLLDERLGSYRAWLRANGRSD
jgi:hypothetical protein